MTIRLERVPRFVWFPGELVPVPGQMEPAVKSESVRFSPDQPRDEFGRWTDTGAAGLPAIPKIGDGKAWGDDYTPEQSGAISAYTRDSFSEDNGYLRNGLEGYVGYRPDAREWIAQDVALIASAARPMPGAMSLLRGVGPEAFGYVENFELDSYANLVAASDLIRGLTGEVVRDRGFLSTTAATELVHYAAGHEVVMHIEAPAGTMAIDARPVRDGEEEIILPPMAGLRIDRVVLDEDETSKIHVYATAVP